MVRFVVVDSHSDIVKGVWQDQAIVESFIRHQNHLNDHYDIDYVTGELKPVMTKAPAKVRNAGDKAKIISSRTSGNSIVKEIVWSSLYCSITISVN